MLFYATATKYNKNKFRMMIQRRFRSCCAHCGYCLLCCCSATAHAAAAAGVQCQSGLLFCCCFVAAAAADLVFVYRNRIRNRNSFYCIQNLQFVFVVVVVVAFGSCLGCCLLLPLLLRLLISDSNFRRRFCNFFTLR